MHGYERSNASAERKGSAQRKAETFSGSQEAVHPAGRPVIHIGGPARIFPVKPRQSADAVFRLINR
jgi:hypothetical protein